MMMWILAVVAVLLLGGVAVVAAGGGAPMKEQGPDRSGRLPAGDGPVSARELRQARFSTVVRGYSMTEVDELLTRLERQLAAAEAPAPDPVDGPGRGDDAEG